jgi:hypothetical protein
VDVALHEGPPVIVLDVAMPPLPVHRDLFREALQTMNRLLHLQIEICMITDGARLHDNAPVVVVDNAMPSLAVHRDLFREALESKETHRWVTDGVTSFLKMHKPIMQKGKRSEAAFGRRQLRSRIE